MAITTIKRKLTIAEMAELYSASNLNFKVLGYECFMAHSKTSYTYKIKVEHPKRHNPSRLIADWLEKKRKPFHQNIFIADLSIAELSIHAVPNGWDCERIEEYVRNKGHKLSECSWGAFEGEIKDYR